MAVAVSTAQAFRPPAPEPRSRPLGAVGMIYTLWRHPLEIWSQAHFELPVLVGKTFLGVRAVINDPAAVRRVLLDNVSNYRKDALQLRILRPGLGTGLLTADGEGWRVPAARARAAVFAAPGRRFRARDAPRRARRRSRGCGPVAARACATSMPIWR